MQRHKLNRTHAFICSFRVQFQRHLFSDCENYGNCIVNSKQWHDKLCSIWVISENNGTLTKPKYWIGKFVFVSCECGIYTNDYKSISDHWWYYFFRWIFLKRPSVLVQKSPHAPVMRNMWTGRRNFWLKCYIFSTGRWGSWFGHLILSR